VAGDTDSGIETGHHSGFRNEAFKFLEGANVCANGRDEPKSALPRGPRDVRSAPQQRPWSVRLSRRSAANNPRPVFAGRDRVDREYRMLHRRLAAAT
jgi:hypothetical protein